jgi:hypothetical protein
MDWAVSWQSSATRRVLHLYRLEFKFALANLFECIAEEQISPIYFAVHKLCRRG